MQNLNQHAPQAGAGNEGLQTGQNSSLSYNDDKVKPVIDHALEYARNGWSVFPCNIDKSPKTRNGLHDASKDPEQIKAWWTRWPDASIGAPTGPVNGWWVLDVDRPKKPGDPDGLVSFAELEAKYGQLPATMKQRTGGGGFHYFFKWNGQKIRNSTGKVSPGIDVRGNGGYVILPPSRHPSGNHYEWINDHDPIPSLEWLINLAASKPKKEQATLTQGPSTRYGEKALMAEILNLSHASEGTRNEALNKTSFAMGQLIAGGELDQGQAEAALYGTALSLGLTDKEIRLTIKSGIESGMKDPRSAKSATIPESGQAEHKEQVYKPLTIANFLSLTLPERAHIIKPVVPEQGLVMVYGPRGNGKTWFVLQMAYGIACGGFVVNHWNAPKARRVLYIDGEMPARTMQERLASIVAGSEIEPPDPSYLSIITPDLQDKTMPNLAHQEGQEALETLIRDVDVVIVDNLACLARHGRENDSESWLPVQTWLLSLRRQGKSVITVHHAGKGGAQRGTSSREDVLDTVISLRRPKDYDPSEGARFEVHLEKARGVYGPEAAPFEAALRTERGAAIWTCRTLEDSVKAQVLALKAEDYSIRDIATETGLSKSKVQRILKGAEA